MRAFLCVTACLVFPVAGALRAQDSSSSANPPMARVTAGVTSGALRFADGRMQEGVSAVLRYHLTSSISLAATPALARVSVPGSLGGASASGLTDLPVEIALDHELAVAASPTVGVGFAVSLPTGSTSTGFGSGALGYSIDAGIGATPVERLSLHAGAGRPLSDFTTQSALGGSGSTWGEAEASYDITDRVSASAGFDGDLSSRDSLGPARAIAAGLTLGVGGPLSVVLNGAHGVSGAAARWTFSVGFGTDFAGLESLGSSSPLQHFLKGLGGQSYRGGYASAYHGSGRARP
ncbi:MAG TPA: hypothetical protein VJU87_10465 [Gemmatimonadaceae bacterium]|nr:hypothetical protein [Gemmatimonadaceae bacterium]